MRKLSSETQKKLAHSERMKHCQLAPYIPHDCSKKIDWHHNLIFASKQSDIPETIIAICSEIHDKANRKDVKERLDWIMLNQMSDAQVRNIGKAINYGYKKEKLNEQFGKF